MAKRQLVEVPQSSRLIRQLRDHPQLPALVPQLQTPTLTRLIDVIGVEDAGPLIAHTTTDQLRRVFDEYLWAALAPGHQERLTPDAFIAWLEVLIDVGDTFTAERLEALGLQFVVTQFASLIEAFDLRDTLTQIDTTAEAFGNYLVLAKYGEEWEVLRQALAALNTDYPDFLAAALSNIATSTRLADVANHAAFATSDEAADRDSRREADGFVTPSAAVEFLSWARTSDLEALVALDAYDSITQRYLGLAGSASYASEAEAIASAGIAELQGVLRAAQTIPRTMRLQDDNARRLPIKELLDKLERTNASAFSERLRELVLLGNLLVAGTADHGERFAEVEAARAALSIVNFGAAYLVSQHALDIDELLARAPGLVRAFRVGWHILHQVPARAARLLVAALREPGVRAGLASRAWILREVDVAATDLVNNVDLARFDDVRDSLAIISLVLEPLASAQLQVLISEFPRLPLADPAAASEPRGTARAAAHRAGKAERVVVRSRHFDTLEDLREVDELLKDLPAQIRL